MFVLGITGGIGSGKSTVSQMLCDKGLRVIDADAVSRSVTDINGIALDEISQTFGNKVIKNNALDRKYLSTVVFNDKTKLDSLSSIIHKYVLEYIASELEKERIGGTKCVVLDVPIPVKHGFIDKCNQIWVVTCNTDIRLSRLVNRGMNIDDARRRIAMQMSDEEYKSLSDFSIDNSGTIEDLEAKVNEMIVNQLHERGIRI